MIGTQVFKPYAECASKRKSDENCAMITLVMRNYYKSISEKKKTNTTMTPHLESTNCSEERTYITEKGLKT